MIYFANLTSIILLAFAISILFAEPWSKSDRVNLRIDSEQTAKLSKNNFK